MYFDQTGLLRYVRNRLKEQARRQRLKSTPSQQSSPAAKRVTELTASAQSSAVFNNPTSSIDLLVSDAAASPITSPLSDAVASCAVLSLSDPAASPITPSWSDAATSHAALSFPDKTTSSATARTPAAPTLAASLSLDKTISSAAARMPAAPTLASTAYQQTKLPFAPAKPSPLGPSYKVPPAQVKPVCQRIHRVSNLVVDNKPHGFLRIRGIGVAIVGRLGRPKKCKKCNTLPNKPCSAQFDGIRPCETCVQYNISACSQIPEWFGRSTPNVFQYKRHLDVGLVLNKISSTTRYFKSLKHVIIVSRHSANMQQVIGKIDLCRTAAHLCMDLPIDPTNIRFSGVQAFSVPSAHIPILEDQEEVLMQKRQKTDGTRRKQANAQGCTMFTNLIETLLNLPGRSMVISPGVDTLTGHWERFTNWVVSMPDPDDWFAVLWETTIGGPTSEDVETYAPYGSNSTRFWGFWKFRQIIDYVQLGTHDEKFNALQRAAIARQDTKDSSVRKEDDMQKGRYGYTEDNEDDDYEDNDEWFR